MKLFVMMSLFFAGCVLAHDDATESADTSAPPPAPCSSEKHRQFDFWVGEWDVTMNGKPAGHNLIKLVYGDCALQEDWTGVSGTFTGGSFNIYDQANDKWHQTWVDVTGTLLELDGGLVDGSMVLSGDRPGKDGKLTTNRITFTPNEDGSVRQHWETSADGSNWNTVFDGHYVKVGSVHETR